MCFDSIFHQVHRSLFQAHRLDRSVSHQATNLGGEQIVNSLASTNKSSNFPKSYVFLVPWKAS